MPDPGCRVIHFILCRLALFKLYCSGTCKWRELEVSPKSLLLPGLYHVGTTEEIHLPASIAIGSWLSKEGDSDA